MDDVLQGIEELLMAPNHLRFLAGSAVGASLASNMPRR